MNVPWRRNKDLKTPDGTLGSGSHVLRCLGVLPLFVFVALIAILVRLDLRAVFEPPLLLPILNTVFLAAIPFVVVYFLARGYVSSGSKNLLLLGCGILTLGSGAFLAGWLLAATGGPNVNVNVTIYNIAALISAVFHAAGAIFLTSAGGFSEAEKKARNVKVILAYLGVLVFTALLAIASLQGALPPFFIQGVGPTMVRHAVLGTAVALFAFSSLIFMVRYARSKADFLYWYSLALALLAVGLLAMLFQDAVGSPIGWTGRSAQYLGGIYFLIASLTTARGARISGIPLEMKLSEFFRSAEAQYKALVETISDAIISVHREGRVLLWNSAAEKIFGYSRDEALDSSLIDLIIPEKYAVRMREELECLATTGKSSLIGRATEIKMKRRDGELFPAELSVSARKTAGEWVGTIIVRDITERKRTEDALQERERFFSGTLNDMLTFVAVLKPTGEIIFVNNTPLGLIGSTLDDVKGMMFYDTEWWSYSEQAKQTIKADIELCASGETIIHEIQVQTRDGLIWIEFDMHPIYDEGGRIKYLVPEGRDITERKQAEAEIKHLNLVLRAIRGINQLMVTEKDRDRLIQHACEILIETKSYFSAWIALLDAAGNLEASAEAGLGDAFQPLREMLQRGELLMCGK